MISRRLTVSFIIFSFIFSFFLMFHSFGYDGTNKNILIARHLWSDFGAHIPLIRSFSMGDNLARLFQGSVQYPIFSGEPIRLHFLFYAFVGILEKSGLPLDWALNIPSALGFFLLLIGIFVLSYHLFHSYPVSILSIIFFIFNGSLSFLQFFKHHPLSGSTISDIVTNTQFPSFGPWDGRDITAFWNLNIYTNQRHLALAFGLILLFIYWITKKASPSLKINPKYQAPNPKQIQNSNVQNTKRFGFGVCNLEFIWDLGFRIWNLRESIIWGIIIGLFPYFHQPSLLIFAVLLVWYFFAFPKLRIPLLVTALTASLLILPQLTTMSLFGISNFEHWNLFRISDLVLRISSVWYPGYLIHDRLTLSSFLSFWFENLGLHAILIPLGFFLLPNRAKKVLIPLFFIFLIGNLFKFSTEATANHKFFNFALILGNMISTYVIISLIRHIKPFIGSPRSRFGEAGRICIFVGFVGFVTLSGVIDFFVIVNDTKGTLADVGEAGNNQTATWIAVHTPKDAVFLNSSFLYHPASLAGRKIFMGWPYFAWSAGYDTYKRNDEMKTMYESRDPKVFCPLLKQHNISFVTVADTNNDPNLPAIDPAYFHKNYTPIFETIDGTLRIYQTSTLCPDY